MFNCVNHTRVKEIRMTLVLLFAMIKKIVSSSPLNGTRTEYQYYYTVPDME